MYRFVSKMTWKKWYPEEIEKNDGNKLDSARIMSEKRDKLTKEIHDKNSYSVVNKDTNICINDGNEHNYETGFCKGEKEGFSVGFDKALLEFNKKSDCILVQMNTFLSNFEQSLIALDDVISSRLVYLVLNISKKVIENTLFSDDKQLLKKIKMILKNEQMVFKKPKILINPQDKKIVENHFGEVFLKYGWTVLLDKKISRGGCTVFLGDTILDSTVVGRWSELCRLILKKEG
ncbi:MAG: FliH/SctL family protein [Buchnera aphidicola (Meitanaphis flavogallis)]